MSRSHFTALAAALALGAFAPRLMAQDTSSTTPTRPDTSGYTPGAGGVDTNARHGSIGATDTAVGGAVDTSSSRVSPGAAGAGSDTSGAAGGAVSDSMAPAGGDTTRTSPGSTATPRAENGGSADTGGGTRP